MRTASPVRSPMSRREGRRPPAALLPFTPWMLWAQLAGRSAQMLLASAQVVAHRSQRMANARHPLAARDVREFTLMGTEKLAAASESAQALTGGVLAMSQPLTQAWTQSLGVGSALLGLWGSRSAGEWIEQQALLWRTAAAAGHDATTASNAAARHAGRVLAPVHSRATANARRLGRK